MGSAQTADGSAERDAWFRATVARLMTPERRDELAHGLDTALVAQSPPFQGDQELLRDLAASSRVQLVSLLTALMAGPVDEAPLPAETRDLARTLAVRGFDLSVALGLYRAAQRFAIGYLSRVVQESALPPVHQVALLAEVWERTAMWISHTLEQHIAVHTAERERLLTGALSVRSTLIRTLLQDDTDEQDDPSGRLGYRLHRHHTAFVLHTRAQTPDALRDLDGLAARLGEALGARGLLTLPSGAHGLWAWAGTDHAPDLGLLDTVTLPDGIQAGVGAPPPAAPASARATARLSAPCAWRAHRSTRPGSCATRTSRSTPCSRPPPRPPAPWPSGNSASCSPLPTPPAACATPCAPTSA
ncbi:MULTISPECIES: hypothetical protein [unclassified Streptomyces]|uniref:hypothetical protein n=1 Tax=unclassified Streptomyces TaxID=2593676 RepID=UPI002365DD04|nr:MULTISPECIES: hypothetical protein [unclassified Streptomyces]MDF3144731.1 hypothetical protein [Streptomyces sp. T21Q-yed]WDF36052.1 hypothetical protein PBV52_04290 [Streptomyces sp. T12]